MVIETLVASLLAVTIFYCVLLNRRLVALRSDEAALKNTVKDLREATEAADRAIKGLKAVATECDETLGGRLKRAGELNQELGRRIAEGNEVVDRLGQIATAGRGAASAGVSDDRPEAIGSEAARAARRISEYRRTRRGQAA